MSAKSGILSTILLVSLLAGLTNSCSTESTKANTVTDPIKIDTGYISGTIIGDVGKEVRIYRGIPYAAPPIGDLRWKPPQPALSWPEIRECTVYGNSSPQRTIPVDLSDMPLNEDCLYLNVLTPAKKAAENLPVMVWLHGGGYEMGSGSNPLYNSFRLAQNGVVLVTVNMRLGLLGLLAHPLLSRESPSGVSGNYLFLDIIAALEWVQRNIAVFGGDSKNITIFGESGGGAKVNCLIASPMAQGLFQKGILESGAAGGLSPGTPMKELETIGEKYFAKLGVNTEADPLKTARSLPSTKIMEAYISLIEELKRDDFTDSAIDGQFLTDTPKSIFREGKQNNVSVITSANLGELTGPGSILMPYVIPDYANVLNGVDKAGQKGYACIFDKVPGRWKEEGCVSFHAVELGYVFGDWDNSTGWLPKVFFLANQSGAKTENPGLTEADKRISERIMAMWTQFAKTGNPNIEDIVAWPAYDSGKDQYLYIGESLEVKSGFSKIAQEQ